VTQGTEYRLLGSLEVVHRGATVSTGPRKKRALLARLLLEANRTVSVEAIVDALWGDQVPSTAVKMVHIYVSQLRKELPTGALQTRPPGYLLEVAPEALDLLRFARLRREAQAAVAGGNAADGARLLRGALALWRGSALAEFSEPFFALEAAHLEELRLVALEDRVDADLSLGRHRDVVGELQVLVAAHALRERLRRQLMLALYRAGRQAEALASYRELRRALRDELGLEPSTALSDLHYKILNHDPTLDVAAPETPPPLQPASGAGPRDASGAGRADDRLIGRVAELDRLEHAFQAASEGKGTTALIAGPAGMGKTRLAGELARRARARGATVLTGRCLDMVGAALPYLPLVEALRPLRGTPALEGLPELSRLLPDSGGQAPLVPSADRHAGESQLQLFEAVLTVLDRLSAAAPLVLVLEDLHWADGSTLDLFAFLAHAIHDGRILILGTWRQTAAQPDAVHRLAAALHGRGLASTVELGPLGQDELHALVARAGDVPLPAELTEAVCARAEGNPFFALELLAAARRGDETLPRLLEDVLLADFDRLEAQPKAIVRVAAAAGRPVPHRLLASAMPLADTAIVEALRRAVDHGVLVPDRALGTYRFRHALIAEAAYATLLPGEREEVHQRLALALTEQPALAAAGELAEHWIAARRPVEALTASIEAARDAQAVSGLSEALRHLERVLELWEQVPHAEEVAGVGMSGVLSWVAELAGAVARCDDEIDGRALAGVLGAGDAADAATVATQLGLTTDAVADAFDRLANERVLERTGDGRFRPAGLAVAEARELYPLVVVLESIAIRQSPPFDRRALDGLEEANRRMRAAPPDASAAVVADDDFHTRLTGTCGNGPLLAALRPVRRALLRYEQVYMLEPERIERSAEQHDGIIEALGRGDHAEAAQRLRRNLTSGLPSLISALDD